MSYMRGNVNVFTHVVEDLQESGYYHTVKPCRIKTELLKYKNKVDKAPKSRACNKSDETEDPSDFQYFSVMLKLLTTSSVCITPINSISPVTTYSVMITK